MKLHILRLGVHNDLPQTKGEKLIDHVIDPICGAVVLLKGKENIIVDTGHLGFKDEIIKTLAKHNLKPEDIDHVINTHSHFDHVGGNKDLKQATGAEILIHPIEAQMLTQLSGQGRVFGLVVEDSPPADRTIDEGDIIEVGAIKLEVFHTPGHSPGSISLVVKGEKKILVGDLVFAGSIGRTDLPGGSFDTLTQSVQTKIFIHQDETMLYSGHGHPTTVGREKRTNPFLSGNAW